MDHQLIQQRAIDALQRDVCEAHADTLRARRERDKAQGEHTRLVGLADGRGYQIERLEAMVDDLLAACEALLPYAESRAEDLLDLTSADSLDDGAANTATAIAAVELGRTAIKKARGES